MVLKTKAIRQSVLIKARPSEVYEALTNPKLHSKFTGSKAVNTHKLGKFSTYDGYAFGENLKLIKDKKIVQTWSCDDFPEGHFSDVTFELKPLEEGTKLTFTQKAVPLDSFHSIQEGWVEFYWEPLKELLEKD